TATAVPNVKVAGGSWLLEERNPNKVFTPEDFTEEHQQIAKTAEEFARQEIIPAIEKIEHKEYQVTRDLLKKASEIGIANIDVPEQYGGSDMDKVSSAFIVERTFPGFSVGAEEKKMGIRGSSTAPLILNDCKVPVENLLGEIGKGHVIAFNILNIGRFKLGAGCVGGARYALSNAIGYA